MFRTIAETFEESLLGKYKVEAGKRGIYRGRGELSEQRMVWRVKKYQPPKWR